MQAAQHAPAHMLSIAEYLNTGTSTGRTRTAYRAPCECSICQTQYRNFACQSIDEYACVRGRKDEDAQALLSSYVKQMVED